MPNRIKVRRPNGTQTTVREENLDAALSQGYDLVTEAREAARESPGQAFVEAGLRGATLGLSATQGDTDAALRAKYNPVASTVGNIAGFALGPGKAVAAAKLPVLAAAGIEGALAGLEPAVSESILENKPLSAERAAASMLAGAATGAGLTKGAQLLGKGASKAGEAAVKAITDEAIPQAAKHLRKQVLKNQLARSSDLKKYGLDERWDGIVDWADKKGVVGADHSSTAALAEAEAEAAGVRMGESLRSLESAQPLSGLGVIQNIQHNPVYRGVQERMAKWLRSVPDRPKAEKLLGELEETLRNPETTWENLRELRSRWNAQVPATEAKGIKQVIESADSALKAEIENSAKRYGGDSLAAAYKEAALDYANAKALGGVASARATEAGSTGLTDYLGGGVAAAAFGGGPAALVAAPAAAFATHQARSRGGYIAAKALEAVGEGQILPKVAKGFQNYVQSILQTAPAVLGPFRLPLEKAAAAGADALVATHARLAETHPDDYLPRIGVTDNAKGAQVYQRISALSSIANAQLEADRQAEKAVSRAFKSSESDYTRTPASTKGLEQKVESLRKLLEDPNGLYGALEGIMDTAPGLGVEAGQTTVRLAQFLVDKAPKDPESWKPPALRSPYTPDQGETERFYRYVDAAERPLETLTHEISSNNVTPETVEVVSTLYPQMFFDLQQRFMERLATYEKPLDYEKKLALSAAFGPGVLGISPQEEQLLQAVHIKATEQGAQGGGPPSADGRQVVNTNKSFATQSQRLEARGAA